MSFTADIYNEILSDIFPLDLLRYSLTERERVTSNPIG